MPDAEHYEEGDYFEGNRKGNFIADDNAMIHWLTPEELERFSEAESLTQGALKALRAPRDKVLARELPGWMDQLPTDPDGQLPAAQDALASATAKELMRPEEELYHKELMKHLGESASIHGQLQRIARERKGGPL